jgi:TusA-related sulfurtransferase
MKIKEKYLAAAGLTVAVLGLVGTTAFNQVFAQSSINPASTADKADKAVTQMGKRALLKNVQHSVKNIANGIEITVTSTDAAMVAKIQSMKHPAMPGDARVTVTQDNITNGVKITVTSTDAEKVKKIQEKGKNGHEFAFGLGKVGFGHDMKKFVKKVDMLKNTQRTVKKIDNGVQITITSTDPETVKKIQQLEQNRADMFQKDTLTKTSATNS